MIKRIFISVVMSLFIINSTLASGLPITDTINLQFNDVSGFKAIGDGYNMGLTSYNSIEYNGNIYYRGREMGRIYKKSIADLNNLNPGQIFLDRGDIHINPMSFIITPDGQSLLFSINNNMLYKKSLSSTDTMSLGDVLIDATSDSIDLNRYKIIGDNLYYTKNGTNAGIYKKNINTLDGSYGNILMPGKRMNDAIAGDGFIVTISQMQPQSISLYDLNNNTERDLGQFNILNGNIDTNQSFVFGSSLFLYGMQKMYKKEITDANGVGVDESNLFIDNVMMARFVPNGKIIYVTAQSTYIKNVTDANNTPGTLWIANSQFLPGIYDKNYITNTSMYYTNMEGLFKKDFSDTNSSSKGTKLLSVQGGAGYLANDKETYIYLKSNQIYSVNLSNPQGYSTKDGFYKSDLKNIGAGKDNLYINIDGNIPSQTNYIFSITNDNKEINYANNNDFISNQVNLSQDRIMNWGGNKTYDTGRTSADLWNSTNIGDAFSVGGIDLIVSNKQDYGGGNFEIYFAGGNALNLDQFNMNNPTKIYKQNGTNWVNIQTSNLNGATEVKQSTIFGSITENITYKIKLLTDDITKTPLLSTVTISDAVVNNVVTPPAENNTGSTNNTATGGIDLSIGDGTNISIPVEKQTTDFIKSLASQTSITPASLNTYDNVETFLKDNSYDYKNQILIGSGVIPSQTMYNVIDLGLSNSALADSLSGAINSSNYAKLVLQPETYLAGKRIINYLKMDKADDNGNLIISVYNSDTGEYIFLKKRK